VCSSDLLKSGTSGFDFRGVYGMIQRGTIDD
jgi:hypothetical protein